MNSLAAVASLCGPGKYISSVQNKSNNTISKKRKKKISSHVAKFCIPLFLDTKQIILKS